MSNSGGTALPNSSAQQFVGASNVSTTATTADSIVDTTISSGTLWVDVNGETGLSSSETLVVQLFVNGVAVGSSITFNSTTGNGFLHVAVSGLGITPGSLVTLGAIQASSFGSNPSGGIISWSVGP